MGYGQGGGNRGGGQKYDNNMQGALFANNEKRRGKQDPDMRGSCEIDGVEYWVNAWWNTAKTSGDEFLKFKLQAKDADNGFEGNRGGGGGNHSRSGNSGSGGNGGGSSSGNSQSNRRGSSGGGGVGRGGGRSGGRQDNGSIDEMDEDIPY